MLRKMISFMSILLLLCTLTLNVAALEEPDMTRKGAIEITMLFEGNPVAGGSLTLYRVADVHEENGADYSFVWTEEYAGSGLSLENIQDPALAKALAEYADGQNYIGIKRTISRSGEITFQELELGLYLLIQEDPAPGYYRIDPFLVSVSTMKDGSYIYEVDGSPKLSLEKDPTPPTTPPPPGIPQTGLTQWPVPVMAAGGLILVVLGWYLCIAGRKHKDEA